MKSPAIPCAAGPIGITDSPTLRAPSVRTPTSEKIAWRPAWWKIFVTRRARKHTLKALSELELKILTDIGVPEFLLAEAQALSQQKRNHSQYWLW